MSTEIFINLMNLTERVGGSIVFMPMQSKSQGLMTVTETEYTQKEMESLVQLAEKNNISVRFTPFMSSGGQLKYINNEARIGVRIGMSFDEYVYNIAHELAHYFLHYDKGDIIESDKRIEYEEQADRGAKMLLAALEVKGKESVLA